MRKARQLLHTLWPQLDHPALEAKLASPEGAEMVWAFCSDMAAGMLRLAVRLEDAADLIADPEQAPG